MGEGESATVRHDGSTDTWAVAWSSEPVREIDLYDVSGAYLRSVGRGGEGPGEVSGVPSRFVFAGGRLTVLDPRARKWLRFAEDGSFLEEWRVPVERYSGFAHVTPDTVLLTGGGSRATIHPLVSLSAGAVVGEVPHEVFVPADTTMRSPLLLGPAAGRSPMTAATAWRHELVIREWSVDGRLVSIIRGSPPGFPELAVAVEEGEPASYLTSVHFDADGRLWLVSHVPAETWREYNAGMDEFRAGRTGPMEVPVSFINSLPRRTAPRLDLFDLERGVHLGTWISDARSIGLLEGEGETLVYQLELEDGLYPSAAVYRFDFPDG
jgi:hypothetical protein